MARMKKAIDVKKFGGTEELGTTHVNDYSHDVQSIETQSKTHLEDDVGHGNPAIIRCFEFGINPEAFKQHPPTKQDLFNYHHKGIEVALWRDGMKVMPDVNPRVVIDESKMTYSIFIGARPMKGHFLREHQQPKTLAQLARDI